MISGTCCEEGGDCWLDDQAGLLVLAPPSARNHSLERDTPQDCCHLQDRSRGGHLQNLNCRGQVQDLSGRGKMQDLNGRVMMDFPSGLHHIQDLSGGGHSFVWDERKERSDTSESPEDVIKGRSSAGGGTPAWKQHRTASPPPPLDPHRVVRNHLARNQMDPHRIRNHFDDGHKVQQSHMNDDDPFPLDTTRCRVESCENGGQARQGSI